MGIAGCACYNLIPSDHPEMVPGGVVDCVFAPSDPQTVLQSILYCHAVRDAAPECSDHRFKGACTKAKCAWKNGACEETAENKGCHDLSTKNSCNAQKERCEWSNTEGVGCVDWVRSSNKGALLAFGGPGLQKMVAGLLMVA